MRAAVLCLLAAAAPAAGQGIPFSAEATESCLAAAADGPAQNACVGLAADACIQTPDGYTTVGMGFCYGKELEFWDERLNAAYGALMAVEEAADAELKELGGTAPSVSAALRDMHRAWIDYRDAVCAYERSQWGGGTGGGPATADCLMRLTGAQALALEARLEQRRAQ